MTGAWEPASLTGAGREPALDGGHEGGEIIRRTSCLIRNVVESSCEGNLEERTGEKEGGRDEAWQRRKRWEPHRKEQGGREASTGSSSRHPWEDRGSCTKHQSNQN